LGQVCRLHELKINYVGQPKRWKFWLWKDVCPGKLKAYIASVMWWTLLKNVSFENFHNGLIDPACVTIRFPSWTRWQKIKRFFKVSDPLTDPEFIGNQLHRVKELFNFFIVACKAHYWSGVSIAINEGIKKIKDGVFSNSILRTNRSDGALRYIASAAVQLVICGMLAFIWAREVNATRKKKNQQKNVVFFYNLYMGAVE
jgi:hypothetical protein